MSCNPCQTIQAFAAVPLVQTSGSFVAEVGGFFLAPEARNLEEISGYVLAPNYDWSLDQQQRALDAPEAALGGGDFNDAFMAPGKMKAVVAPLNTSAFSSLPPISYSSADRYLEMLSRPEAPKNAEEAGQDQSAYPIKVRRDDAHFNSTDLISNMLTVAVNLKPEHTLEIDGREVRVGDLTVEERVRMVLGLIEEEYPGVRYHHSLIGKQGWNNHYTLRRGPINYVASIDSHGDISRLRYDFPDRVRDAVFKRGGVVVLPDLIVNSTRYKTIAVCMRLLDMLRYQNHSFQSQFKDQPLGRLGEWEFVQLANGVRIKLSHVAAALGLSEWGAVDLIVGHSKTFDTLFTDIAANYFQQPGLPEFERFSAEELKRLLPAAFEEAGKAAWAVDASTKEEIRRIMDAMAEDPLFANVPPALLVFLAVNILKKMESQGYAGHGELWQRYYELISKLYANIPVRTSTRPKAADPTSDEEDLR